MAHRILGLHHVTATVDRAQDDLDFCVGALGLRLVKKTVNFDNRHVYHFYYGDERGTPGTIWTTFPYHGRHVRVGAKGAGQVTATSFSVPSQALDFWASRLEERGLPVREGPGVFGEETIHVTDPSGLAIELHGTDRDVRTPWTSAVPREAAVRGVHSVTLTVHEPGATVGFLRDVFGFDRIEETAGRIRMGASGGEPGRIVDVVHDPGAARAANGLGTVHHVAFAIGSAGEQLAVRDDLIERGFDVTDVMDRQYFTSIYFREPGGVLFEVATVEPGFTVDEAMVALGEELKLPPWEEPNRGLIEAGLAQVTVPRPSAGQ
jgi:glyoxalase family protein